MWKMRIFEIRHDEDNKEWISGKTLFRALLNYTNTTECSLSDLADAEIVELPDTVWHMYFIDQEGPDGKISFNDWIKENDKYPEIISGTMYE